MHIVDLDLSQGIWIEQIAAMSAQILNWENALDDVIDCFRPDTVNRVALDENHSAIGWISAFPMYDGHVWQVMPLIVRRDSQNKGYGSRLLESIEQAAAEKNGWTLLASCVDHHHETSLSYCDIYQDLPSRLNRACSLSAQHPLGFFSNNGFQVVGIIPDSWGYGKPDILLAKRIRHHSK